MAMAWKMQYYLQSDKLMITQSSLQNIVIKPNAALAVQAPKSSIPAALGAPPKNDGNTFNDLYSMRQPILHWSHMKCLKILS